MSDTDSRDRVLARTGGGVGRITLNRPEVINAVDVGMVETILATLRAWREDPEIEVVLIDGAGERGLCAGGDVRALRDAIVVGDIAAVDAFFLAEYRANALIGAFPKPVVAFMDGVTMGGGIGLSAHAGVRIVTERSRLAMPETRLGFTPDVGGSWLLSHAPGRLGEFLALTSWTMGPADAIHCGFADHLVPSGHLDDLRHALQTRADPGTPNELALLFDESPEAGPVQRARPWIDEAFSAGSVAEIIDRLRGMGEVDGEITPAAALAELEQRAPLALEVTLRAVRRSRELPGLNAAIEQEHHLVSYFVRTQPDMPEGIRAQVVDKDRTPRWRPATLTEVTPQAVDEAFAHRSPRPLWDRAPGE
ncbi:enoyl-CoA hydratase/isomerase family protein [Microbacterium sp. Marseille-Q6965]|uniref:enoyl-CoA hydratase/isomerase family protein n=1 Tax=Microbacterium sp. Marseille-Q6965 TaxID=2965072 RepID=UPI0021B76E00|nr:enoyl-CoA hydratase/isomerase family protein [Microbacterium sp. Marseille-Q6965]